MANFVILYIPIYEYYLRDLLFLYKLIRMSTLQELRLLLQQNISTQRASLVTFQIISKEFMNLLIIVYFY